MRISDWSSDVCSSDLAANHVSVFLMADAVSGCKAGQKTPDGYYNVERMLRRVTNNAQGEVLLCGTCLDARGIKDEEVMPGARRSTMDELAAAKSEEHTSELQSLMRSSYAVFCLKKKK